MEAGTVNSGSLTTTAKNKKYPNGNIHSGIFVIYRAGINSNKNQPFQIMEPEYYCPDKHIARQTTA
ncbi:hypothetical protein SAMN05444362_101681 [Dysgonomonas macrotermitis]|uniref:Uncharacterized protein n=1 Tax=Dysgonomonas macrotermitis TaxID=1346286 RepID=A0A1M4US73_9BACT|nr:hypothetical protein SAMN05444362_101681 [Dysgonomonas macrotermitis]